MSAMPRKAFRSLAILAALLGANAPATTGKRPPAAARKPRIGVFYFPGWNASAGSADPWDKIRPYADRKPLLGWYRQDDPAVMSRQIRWMGDNGLSFVAFDWYFNDGKAHSDDALNAYLRVPQTRVGFGIMWANHDQPTTPDEMRAITALWIERYFRDSRYLRVDGRPVVFIFSYEKFRADALSSGSSATAYMAQANAMARSAGLPGIYFVGGTDDSSDPGFVEHAAADRVDAAFSYNLHRKPRSAHTDDPDWWKPFHGYSGLDAAYRAQWLAGRSLPVPYVLPMSAGWDKRPWGGSGDALHDRSVGTPAQFGAHLAAARDEMRRMSDHPSDLGVICCWNEYGEGSFVEPTRPDGFARLEQVRRVFGPGR